MSDLNGQIHVDDAFDLRAWILGFASPDMPWLLAHADDGVIWGVLDGEHFKLSSDIFDNEIEYPSIAVSLRTMTLQEARVFGPGGETLIWRTETGFAYHSLLDGAIPGPQAYEESVLLVGTWVKETNQGFAVLVEGQQGLMHAPPVTDLPASGRLRLTWRHYLEVDPQGQAYIQRRRLVRLEP